MIFQEFVYDLCIGLPDLLYSRGVSSISVTKRGTPLFQNTLYSRLGQHAALGPHAARNANFCGPRGFLENTLNAAHDPNRSTDDITYLLTKFFHKFPGASPPDPHFSIQEYLYLLTLIKERSALLI
jgi:hypothetical protein